MPRTVVRDLNNMDEYIYTLRPEQAVVACYEQQVKHNYNTWDYLHPLKHPEFRIGEKTVSCGDFVAMKKERK